VAVIGDFLKDLDDEHTLCGLAGLVKLGWVRVLAVVGNLAPADLRARGAKGTLKMLGLGSVPVAVGLPVFEGKQYPYEAKVPYLSEPDEVELDGQALLVRTLRRAEDKSVILILQSGLTDAAALLRDHEELFKAKVMRVAIMGGVEVENDALRLDTLGRLVANNANNNEFDKPAAVWLYERLQEVGVPMVITMRDLAYAAQVPFSAYDRMEATGNPVGECLKNRQMPALQHLFEAACSPAGSEIRGTLPADRNRAWVVKVFCAGVDPEIEDGGEIWPYVGSFNLYDPSNAYASIDDLQQQFLIPTVHVYNGVTNLVFGLSPKNNGVKSVTEFADFMVEIECLGLQK